jgi:hypothetical protein
VGFSVRSAMFVMLAHGLLRWWKAELANAWTYVVKPRRPAVPEHESRETASQASDTSRVGVR